MVYWRIVPDAGMGSKTETSRQDMVIALAIICALGIGIGAAWVMSGPRQQPDRAAEACWSTLADQLDLDYDAGGLLKGPRISGQIEGMSVYMDTLHQVRDGRKSLLTRFVLQHENLPEGLDRKSKAKPSDDPVKRAIAQVTRRNVSELTSGSVRHCPVGNYGGSEMAPFGTQNRRKRPSSGSYRL